MSASGDGAGFSSDHLFSRTLGRLLKIEKGEGIYLWDSLGKRYIDGSSGPVCVNIGHGVKEIKEAVAEQMKNISYVFSSHFVTESVLKCAEKISSFSPDNMEKTYFCSGGSEATEAAAKLSRQYHLERGEDTRYKVIARWQSYHGNTLGALSMSGNIIRRNKYVPMLLDFPHIPPAYCYRCPFSKTKDNCDLDCAHALDWEIKANGAEYVSAFIAEPIVGATLGTLPAPPGYFQIIREICDKYGVLFIADEVMTGLGRTGKNWGIQHWNVTPDIITAAKGLSGGYMPLGACIVHDKVSDAFTNPFAHGHTYGSHPVACAVGIAVLEYIEKHKLVDRSAKLGAYFHTKLQELYHHPTVGDIRGIGLFAGIEFVIDKDSKKPFHPSVAFYRRVVDRCAKNGLLVYPGMATVDGVIGDHIQVAPPLVIKKDQIDELLDILDRSLYDVEGDVL
jgi:adenosylmethionine-8-amino-7-oxononanoate aminotransferase